MKTALQLIEELAEARNAKELENKRQQELELQRQREEHLQVWKCCIELVTDTLEKHPGKFVFYPMEMLLLSEAGDKWQFYRHFPAEFTFCDRHRVIATEASAEALLPHLISVLADIIRK